MTVAVMAAFGVAVERPDPRTWVVAPQAYRALGVPDDAGYFASRAAAMGPVPAEVVMATFYNFCPDVVRSAIPAA